MTEFHAGDTIAGYRLEARLGGGGFGIVWRARRISDGRLVAIKLLPEGADGVDEAHLRADVELLAASAASQSPHVVQVLDGGVDPVPYVVMEFVAGTSLAEELRQRQRLSQLETVELGLGIADALQALNAAGIVHRDVKPSNVMLDRAGVVKLTDFGIAKIAGFDAATATGQVPLSISYAAPEVWEGKAEHRSDLYALAVVLYQCLTGLLPFRGSYAELFYQHRSAQPELGRLPLDTTPSLARLIRECLQKDVDDRPATAVDCIQLLESARAELQAGPRPQPDAREPERFGRWLRLEPVEGQDWAWHARHERTGQEAIVEVHTAESVDYGEVLRRAVEANPKLVPLGAETLLGTNRLILRPSESWRLPPTGAFQFWVARDVTEEPSQDRPPVVVATVLLRAVEALVALIDAANNAGLPLNLSEQELSLLPDGRIYLRHPGFPIAGTSEPEQQALSFLRGLPLTRDLRQIVQRAGRLDDVRKALAILVSVQAPAGEPALAPGPSRPPQPPRPPRRAGTRPGGWDRIDWRWLAGLAGSATVALVAALLVIMPGSGGNDPTITASATVPPSTPTPPPRPCLDLALPAPLTAAQNACREVAPAFVFNEACPRGEACRIEESAGGVTIAFNDRAVAYIDRSGNLVIAREDGSQPVALTTHGLASQPAWSPDGRYLAYVLVQQLELPPSPEPVDPRAPRPYTTQLRIIEAGRAANDGVLLASSALALEPWQRQYVSSPQWSQDGSLIYFSWTPVGQAGGPIYSALVPRRGEEVDFGSLRSGVPASDTLLPRNLSVLDLSPADFGIPNGVLGRFALTAAGPLFVEACSVTPEGQRARCSLGRWDERATTVMAGGEGHSFDVAPATNAQDLAYVLQTRPEGASLLRIDVDGKANDLGLGLVSGSSPDTPARGSRLTARRAGEGLLVEATPGTLSITGFAAGTVSAWAPGGSPAWFTSNPESPTITVGLPAHVRFSTPTPTPTITPTPTPTPTSRPPTTPTATPTRVPEASDQQMTLFVTVRRGPTLLADAIVSGQVDGEECVRGMADASGRVSLLFPREGAPVRCRIPGATIRFQVNGDPAPTSSTFQPGASFPVEILMP